MMFFFLLCLIILTQAKHPILLVPGFGGSQLEQKETKATKILLDNQGFCCQTQFDWTRVWLVLTDILPYAWECFAQRVTRNFVNGSWHDKANIFTRIVEGIDSIAYMDNSNFLTKRETVYFGSLIEYLKTNFGYNDTNLAAAPYDWRLLPAEQAKSENKTAKTVFSFMQSTIEKLVTMNNGERAIITTHSMGGLFTHYFFTKIVTEQWKTKFIEKWIAISSPFLGSPKAIQSVLSGYNFGIPILTNAQGLEVAPHIGTSYYLMPQEDSEWNTLVTTSKGMTFNSSEIAKLLAYANITEGEKKFNIATSDWSKKNPNVSIHLVSGVNVTTEISYLYNDDSFVKGPLRVNYASGDGTVPEMSSFYPSKGKWNVTSVKKFDGLDHVGILANSEFIQWFVQIIT